MFAPQLERAKKKSINKAVGGMAREKNKSGDKTRRRGVFIRDTVPVIGCEAGSRRTNGQI